jgi:predicted GNAT family N-acyltransferase
MAGWCVANLENQPRYLVKPLAKQDRAAFSCGKPDLDKYFLERASRDVREKLAAVFVLLREKDEDTVLGYYTLSSLYIDAGEIPEELRKRTGRYRQVGATLIGRLAVATPMQKTGIGEFLPMDALARSLQGSKSVMSFAVLVDAMDKQAEAFYRKYGFVGLKDNRLFLPMKTVEALPLPW